MNIKATAFTLSEKSSNIPSMDSAMWKRACDAWYNVPQTAIEILYKYVPRPIATVIEAKI